MSALDTLTARPLSKDETRNYGRKVGAFTGLLGYFGGALGAWAGNMMAGRASAPQPRDTVLGALAGIAVVTLFGMWLFWKPYRGRPYRMAKGAAVANVVQSFGALVTGLMVLVYAGTVMLMWVLASAFLAFAIAA